MRAWVYSEYITLKQMFASDNFHEKILQTLINL